MGAENSSKNVKEADGFYLGPNREELLVADRQARQRIAELEQRVADLEARPRIWTGTEEEYEADNAAGKIREGDLIITPEGDEQAQEGGTA